MSEKRALLGHGEKVHVIERRNFEGDARRHFVGEVEAITDVAVRVVGYAFVGNPMTADFDCREPTRIRISRSVRRGSS